MSDTGNSGAFGGADDFHSGHSGAEWQRWLLLLPLLASWGYAAWLYARLPAQVPVHWGLGGQVDRYGGPAEAALTLPVIISLLSGVLLLAAALGLPRTPAYAATRRGVGQLLALVVCFLLYVQVVTSQPQLGRAVPLPGLLTLGAGVLFVLMGNLLPKLRRNALAGARLPWTIQDEVAWVKSQRATGWAFAGLGLALVRAAALPGMLPLWLLLAGKALVVAGVVWYTWRVSRQAHAPVRPGQP
jgi:uncharacterized membrane protein